MIGKRVIVAGHACVDLTPVFPEGVTAGKISDVLVPGSLINTTGTEVHVGGAVSNTGIAMKRLGVDVCLMAKVGVDAFGGLMRSIYAQDGADNDLIEAQGEPTSHTIVMVIPGLDRFFIHAAGCNDTFTLDDIPKDKLDGVSLFHFGYPPLMRSMYENDGEELVRLFKYMKSRNIATSLDMASVDDNSPAAHADWQKILGRVLPYVDFFVPSAEELCRMLNEPLYREWERRSNGDITGAINVEKDVRPLADMCLQFGAKVVVIKCGAPGIYYKTASVESLTALGLESWADREGFEASYLPDKMLSATGAGDTAIAAFLTAMLEGYDLDMCVRLATAEGASCLEGYDALSGLRTIGELKKKINAGWVKRPTDGKWGN